MRSTRICGPIATIRFCRTPPGGSTDAAQQPIVLVADEGNPNGAKVRFLIDNAALPADIASYDRMVLVFNGDDDEARRAGARRLDRRARRRVSR